MIKGLGSVELYCNSINISHVHCNKYRRLQLDIDETPREAIERSDWEIVDGEIRCEDHLP